MSNVNQFSMLIQIRYTLKLYTFYSGKYASDYLYRLRVG